MLRIALAAAVIASVAPAQAADRVTGRWLTHKGNAVVEIGSCGDNLCGRIARIIAPPRDGTTTDARNPDPALRGRPMLGLPILTGFVAKGAQWHGRVYDPQEGKSYRSTLDIRHGTLKVKGCVALFCKTLTWTRVR